MSDHKGLTLPDLEKRVADQMIALMEKKGIHWTQGWATPLPAQNFATNHVYRGTNVLTTGIAMMTRGFTDPRFVSFKQAIDLGGNVRKGSKGIPIIFYGKQTKEDDQGEERTRRFARLSYVFSVTDVDGIDLPPLPDVLPEPVDRNAAIDAFVAATGVRISNTPNAFYSDAIDGIGIPPMYMFRDGGGSTAMERYYSTLLHELIHFTGPEKRLNRECFRLYHSRTIHRAREELIAEIGSVMLGQRLGLQTQPADENAAYVQAWIKHLRDRPAAIFEAAAAAAKAVELLESMQPREEAQAA